MSAPTVDDIAQAIRAFDGDHTQGAGRIAQMIHDKFIVHTALHDAMIWNEGANAAADYLEAPDSAPAPVNPHLAIRHGNDA